MESCNHNLTKAETNRNRHTECGVYWHDPEKDFKYSSSLPQIFPDIVRCHARCEDTRPDAYIHILIFNLLILNVLGCRVVLKRIHGFEIERVCVSAANKTSPWTPGKSSWDTPEGPSIARLFTSADSPLCSTSSTRCVPLSVWPGRQVQLCSVMPAAFWPNVLVVATVFHPHLSFFSFIRRRLAWWCSSRAAEGRTPSWTSCQVARERR